MKVIETPSLRPTLRDATRDYFAVRKLKESTEADYTKRLQRCFKDWLDAPISTISDEMVLARHADLTRSAGGATANLAMRILRALMNFARIRYRSAAITTNPVEYLGQLRAWHRLMPRQNYIQPHQMEAWFDAVSNLKQHATRDFLIFVLLTGCRRSEALNLFWNDVDFVAETVTFRGTKNGTDHRLPLSDYLLEVLESRKLRSKSRFVFSSGRLPDAPLRDWRRGHASVVHRSGVPFSVHDLRRTFLTVADSLDIPMHVLKRLANHASSDVTERYVIRSIDRLREPMQRISDEILRQAAQVATFVSEGNGHR